MRLLSRCQPGLQSSDCISEVEGSSPKKAHSHIWLLDLVPHHLGLSFGLLTAWQPLSPQSQWSERDTEATVFLEPSLGSYLPSFLLYSVGHWPTLAQCRRELPTGTNIREGIYWRLPWRLPITQTKEHQGRPPIETKTTGRSRIGVSVSFHSSWRFIRSSSPVH